MLTSCFSWPAALEEVFYLHTKVQVKVPNSKNKLAENTISKMYLKYQYWTYLLCKQPMWLYYIKYDLIIVPYVLLFKCKFQSKQFTGVAGQAGVNFIHMMCID